MQEQAASEVSPVALASAPDDLVQAISGGAVLAEFRPALGAAEQLLRHIVRARLVSAKMVTLQRAARIGFHATSIGIEAAVVGAVLAMRETDWVFPGARDWYAALVRGSLAPYVHHAFGSAHDPAKGHAAPDHLPARARHVVSPSGVPSAHLPQAVGAAWAAKIRGDRVATLALFGSEVATSGDFHNALNFAGVFRAPVVFVCRSESSDRVVDRAVAYGLANARVDGTDALAVYAVVKEAVSRAEAGKGATLVEVVSPRVDAASLTDAALSSGELFELGERDALVRLQRTLASENIIEAGFVPSVVREVSAEIDAAVAAAENAGPPPVATMFEDVYARIPAHLERERAGLETIIGG